MTPREIAELNEESLRAAIWYVESRGGPEMDIEQKFKRINDVANGFYMGWVEAKKRGNEGGSEPEQGCFEGPEQIKDGDWP